MLVHIAVELLAFGQPDEVRLVSFDLSETPETLLDDRNLFDEVFHWGQNEFQSQRHPSVSAGDVINWNNKKILIVNSGFKELTLDEYNQYKALDRQNRFISIYTTN